MIRRLHCFSIFVSGFNEVMASIIEWSNILSNLCKAKLVHCYGVIIWILFRLHLVNKEINSWTLFCLLYPILFAKYSRLREGHFSTNLQISRINADSVISCCVIRLWRTTLSELSLPLSAKLAICYCKIWLRTTCNLGVHN